ncbi:MAG: NAD(P)-dependent malic enzyme [Bacillota bacterium]|jgi:malate dehydrogenase (oxaloacetate-decarboxylating)
MDYNKTALELHEKKQGKLEIVSKVNLESRDDLSVAYTPGVAEPCRKIHECSDDVYKYTVKKNTVAVVSDGSAVLGLGNIGGNASIPVMEGKAVLFKAFGDIDAFPICLDTQDDEEIIKTVKNIAPVFGGINLEDINAPRCFYIEKRLKAELDIPVFHDDQHGTAVCVLASVINGAKVLQKDVKALKVVINGIGAAGSAICRILLSYGIKNIVLCDKNGIINQEQQSTMLNWNHTELASVTNPHGVRGGLAEALQGADVFIGVSRKGLLKAEMIKTMNKNPMIFAMANPEPEIYPEEAKAAGAAIVGTGRSDYPNQINNVLVFPGMFKGALAVRASDINEEMKMAAAVALADYIKEESRSAENILPSALDKNVAAAIAAAVSAAAKESGVARI